LAGTHPVFLFTYAVADAAGAFSLVLKAETGPDHGRPRYDAAAEIVAAISPNSVSESLTEEELVALRAIARGSKATLLLKEWVESARANRAFFVKMKYRQRFTDLQKPGFGGLFEDGQKNELLDMMGKLERNENFWKSLGEVVCTDFFIGNGDRIMWVGPKGEAHIQNSGNIFLKSDRAGVVKKSLHLDFFNTFGGDPGNLTIRDIQEWKEQFAPCLKDEWRAIQFADSVVEAICNHAAGADVYVPLGQVEAKYFLNGFMDAKNKLKGELARRNRNQLPAGVVARAVYLGWLH
jgi:hypothetical protein